MLLFGCKAAECEANLSPPSNTWVKMGGALPLFPPTFLHCVDRKHFAF